ncbi:hypothetical protein RBB79_08415 [Tunturiibacter empetritectus]|uniref:Uncharacterized protein n=1 Tax=Tunturiibacter lichenicola TaxID=2051959 RepID=A0A852VH80_9BACT|nr:hypothetical protein [Edaphobacter lichenicola]NYF89565.1 hypothetical protein [Edaphobacter lichenicola]
MRMLRVAMMGVVLMMGVSGRVSGGEPKQFTPPPQRFPGQGHQPDDMSPNIDSRRAEQQEEVRSTERQKRLVADTDKLLALATDLKQQVDKTNKNILSVDVIKKADEIEKLAHSVKERMKG